MFCTVYGRLQSEIVLRASKTEAKCPTFKLLIAAAAMCFSTSGGGGAGAHSASKKSFYVAGIVDPAKHYIIDRSAWHGTLASKLADGTCVLLHAHRQGGKSSAASAVGAMLEARGEFCVVALTMECVRPTDAAATWTALEERVRGALLAFPRGMTPPPIAARLREGPLFVDDASFHAFFSTEIWQGARVVLIIDEFDSVLETQAPVRTALLSALRSLITARGVAPPLHASASGSPSASALHAVLGIGVYQLLQLAAGDEPDRRHSPFNIEDALTVPAATLDQVARMLHEFALASGHDIPDSVVTDMFWRSGGHVGLLSLLGQQLQKFCDKLAPGCAVDEASWIAVASGSGLSGAMLDSATVASMLRSVASATAVSSTQFEARRIVRAMLSAPADSWLEVALDDPSSNAALSYLVAEGVIVEDHRAGTKVHRIVAPMVVPLLMLNVGSSALVARLPRLPFARRPDGTLDLLKAVVELLPFINLESVFHPSALLKSGQPCEYAYHFQLCDLMAHRAADGGWRVLGETRSPAAHGPLRRLDLLIASNGSRCGVILLVDGKDLALHVYEQAPTYRAQQRLSGVLVVNFACSAGGVLTSIPAPLSDGVELLQVLVDPSTSTLTPCKLDLDGRTAVALACLSSVVNDAVKESLVAPLAGLSESSKPTAVIHAGVEFGIDAATTVGELLAAIGAEIKEPKDSLFMWRLLGDGTERQLANAFILAAAPPGSRFELRHAPGIARTPLIVEFSRISDRF